MKAPINLAILEARDEKPVKLVSVWQKLNALIRRLDLCYRYLRSDVESLTANYNAGTITDVANQFVVGAASFFKKDDPPEEDLIGLLPVLKFDSDSDEQAYYSRPIPYPIKVGSTISAVVMWTYEGAPDAGKVLWGLEYIDVATGEAYAGSSTTIAGLSAGSHTSGGKIATALDTGITGAVANDCLGIRIFRNADDLEDTLAVDACLVMLHLKITEDKLGEKV